MLPQAYQSFYTAVVGTIPADDMFTDPLRTLTYGTDASFYRLIPKIVINVENEEQVRLILREAGRRKLPVTFRAAGTSLSGQAVTDSILVRLKGDSWNKYRVFDNAQKIQLQPGIIGGSANRILAEFGKKIGPDPASIESCKIGGILANNASGMCCGVEQNSYQTLDSMRIILADGTVVDTSDDNSKAAFRKSHSVLLDGLSALRQSVLDDPLLYERISYKFKIKNTTGYSLNALIDFEDPFEIMQHLLVGSEGTLGFIADAVYKTVVEHKHKASALILYPDMKTACDAIPILRQQPVAAAELIDRAGLASVEEKDGMPDYLKELGKTVTALLVETRAESHELLQEQIAQICTALEPLPVVRPIEFTAIPTEFGKLWTIRKGLFPAVGAVREIGTTVIIEDVAFPGEYLASAALDLQAMFDKYNYSEAIIFGHALDGNLHFVFTQDFSIESEVVRYRQFMDDVVAMVVEKYDGSLKAEHGTGRNMAPFVEKEWGEAAYELMKRIKTLFDAHNLLNPGVILNEDFEAHIKNLKPLPESHELVDTCIECGFCELVCPSKNVTLTPRQRIVGRREISRRVRAGEPTGPLEAFIKDYQYDGKDTCAADGMCATRCPVSIDTGKMIKALREESNGELANKIAHRVKDNFAAVTKVMGTTLDLVDKTHQLVGTRVMEGGAELAHKLSKGKVPLWNREMPTAAVVDKSSDRILDPAKTVVYFPSCAARAMGGPSRSDDARSSLPEVTRSLLHKARFAVLSPARLDSLCCGQAFESKGFMEQADAKSAELSEALLKISDNGRYPILCDTSPCLYRMKQTLDKRLKLYEPVEFVLQILMDHLTITQKEMKIAIHPTCSLRKMGLENRLHQLAKMCATDVVWPEEIYCCGFAGDRGFSHPELNASALHSLKDHVCDCEAGYSTSKTCEIGLSLHSQIPYLSILNLVDDVTC